MLNRFYFPPTLPHSTHIRLWCRAGNPTQDLYHQERQLRPSQNIQKDVKSILFPTYPPAFHPHSFVVPDRKPTHDLHHQERQLRPTQNIQMFKKKMLNRFYFPPTLPHSTHILLWRQDRRTNT
ncbi:hypothetical protein TNCV_456611 [Trichonephila clavipes]|uniref:Uncharacterized protein n=1 Tax=Trichonephila clavipes TaxID=2585209 RepID=A0A8X6RZF5_TRICX|nr:hypothetical protein TNCV_456611 [Trichonephila clavipes]